MSNEASVRIQLMLRNLPINYISSPTDFRVDVTGKNGPGPGALTVTTSGIDVSFTQFITPTLCWLMNLDQGNFVEFGMYDGTNFLPLGELGPGEFYILKLSRNLGSSYGSGTAPPTTGKRLRLKANTASCVVVVNAFEK